MIPRQIIVQSCINMILLRQKEAMEEIENLNHALRSETKSSVGDKHETGRAKLQSTIEQHQQQLFTIEQQKAAMMQINVQITSDAITIGNIVETDKGIYFLSIALGKVVIDESFIFALSANSPLGQQLLGKKKGDKITFRNKMFEILSIH